ncbi:unnamed protein product [Mycena citricolor]|uniref:Uncharacterized protein n=1 Tax=Mycena citricolor TaxID=2018698 RepID=A0AAD2HTX9_9AGAR|nr:unnamed protein product [Mycena citricolor]
MAAEYQRSCMHCINRMLPKSYVALFRSLGMVLVAGALRTLWTTSRNNAGVHTKECARKRHDLRHDDSDMT